MEQQPGMLDFVKAMSDVERLHMIGRLTKGPVRANEIASEFGMPLSDAFDHLSFLEYVGVVRKTDDVYDLDMSGMETLARSQLEGAREEVYTPAPELDSNSRKVLATYLNADGSIKQIPSQPAKLKVILAYMVNAFAPGAVYNEKEVNTILRRFSVDVSGLRRYLVDASLLQRERDGSKYWRAA